MVHKKARGAKAEQKSRADRCFGYTPPFSRVAALLQSQTKLHYARSLCRQTKDLLRCSFCSTLSFQRLGATACPDVSYHSCPFILHAVTDGHGTVQWSGLERKKQNLMQSVSENSPITPRRVRRMVPQVRVAVECACIATACAPAKS